MNVQVSENPKYIGLKRITRYYNGHLYNCSACTLYYTQGEKLVGVAVADYRSPHLTALFVLGNATPSEKDFMSRDQPHGDQYEASLEKLHTVVSKYFDRKNRLAIMQHPGSLSIVFSKTYPWGQHIVIE